MYGVQARDGRDKGSRLTRKHFRNTLRYIAMRQRAHSERELPTPSGAEGEDQVEERLPEWESVDVVGACLKMGISR